MTDAEAKAAHARWSTDPALTITAIAAELGVPLSSLYARWVRLGLTSRARHALRGLDAAGQIPMRALRAAWEQYPARTLTELAAELGIHRDSLRRRWRALGWSLAERRGLGRSPSTPRGGPIPT